MADPNNPSNLSQNASEALGKLLDISEELREQEARYSNLTKMAGVHSSKVRDVFSSYTSISSILRDIVDETSTVIYGKEHLEKLERRIQHIQGKQRIAVEQMSRLQAQKIESKVTQSKDLEKEILDLEKQKTEKQEQIKRNQQRGYGVKKLSYEEEAISRKIEIKTEELSKLMESGEILKYQIYKDQAEQLEEALKLTEGIKKKVEEMSIFKKRSFWSEMAKNIFPSMSSNVNSMNRSMKQFGVRGGIIAVGAMAAAGAFKLIVDAMFRADQDATNLSRSMTLTREASRDTLTHFERISNESGDLLFSSKDILKSQLAINNALGTSMFMREQDLMTITKSLQLLNMSEEALAGLAKFSFVSGKNFEDIKNEVFGTSKSLQIQNGLFLDDKKILESVLKTTGVIRLNFKGSTKELAAAVTRAKMLGVTLEQVNKTSEMLLNFEQSISAELEAELLTGKRFNLERARSAALTGDMNTVMEEMNRQAGSFDEYMDMNVIQQQKLAEMFGFSRDEFSDMLFEQTALNKMRSMGIQADQNDLIKRFDEMKARGEDVVKVLGEAVAERLEVQSAQEKMNKVIEKLSAVLERLVQGGLIDKAVLMLANFVKYMTEGGSVIGALMGFGNPDNPYTMESLGIKPETQAGSTYTPPRPVYSYGTPGTSNATANNGQTNTKMVVQGEVKMDGRQVGTIQAMSFTKAS